MEPILNHTKQDAPSSVQPGNLVSEEFLRSIGLFGESPAFRSVLRMIPTLARKNSPLLIRSEAGTCRERLARAIHYCSANADRPFVQLNCSNIPQELKEAEIFGHSERNTSGAKKSRGLIEAAEGGTVLLEEITELTIPVQARLARFLESGRIHGNDNGNSRKMDARIIATTSANIDGLVTANLFRADLLQRLDSCPILLPALRDRVEDIPLIARWLASKYATESGRKAPVFDDGAIHALQAYSWPGNVVELEAVIHHLVLWGPPRPITATDLPSRIAKGTQAAIPPDRSLAEAELEHIRNVMAAVKGNKTHAARVLGIDRKTLRQKLRQPERHDLAGHV